MTRLKKIKKKNSQRIIKYSSLNLKEYDNKYKKGYGIKYPEGHVIRHSSIFKNKNLLLDFGCGNGTHISFFKGLNVKKIYGVDTSNVIKKITKRKGVITYKINEYHDFSNDFKEKSFDIIFSNQVLYYLDDREINFYLSQFNKLLKGNGIIFTTWMGRKCNYYTLSKKVKNSSLRKITFNKRLKETTYINFKSKNQIKSLFKKNKFQTVHMGYYDQIMNFNVIDSGSFHYLHVGKKILKTKLK